DTLTMAELEAAEPAILGADVFLPTLEVPSALVARAVAMARRAAAPIVLNPAPASALDGSLLAAISVVTPNEVEAATLLGARVSSVEDALGAARALRERGAAAAIVTLGERGAVLSSAEQEVHLPAFAIP